MIQNCDIRELTVDDLPTILKWRNHLNVRRFMFNQHEISLHEHLNWFANVSQDPTRRLLIVQDKDQAFGYVQFNNVCDRGVADWGFYVCPNSPKGSGMKMGITAINYGFRNLNLYKICGQAIDENLTSINFHLRMGFKLEGVLRDQKEISGVKHSLHCFGLIAGDWKPEEIIKERK